MVLVLTTHKAVRTRANTMSIKTLFGVYGERPSLKSQVPKWSPVEIVSGLIMILGFSVLLVKLIWELNKYVN